MAPAFDRRPPPVGVALALRWFSPAVSAGLNHFCCCRAPLACHVVPACRVPPARRGLGSLPFGLGAFHDGLPVGGQTLGAVARVLS